VSGSAEVRPARYADTVEEAARTVLPEEVHRYVRAGSGRSISTREAASAWDALRFVPRVLRDVTDVDLTTTLLGTEVRSPFGVAPTTLQRAAHSDGEAAMATGVAEAGGLLVVSSNAGTTFEEIADAGAPWWLQMYVTADRSATAPVLERAVAAGARALVLTADTPVVGTKELGERSVWDHVEPGWLRVNFPAPGTGSDPSRLEKARDLGPQDVAWLADTFGVPVVVKGVLHPADARRCVDAGAAAVWVSNHGGRQLDQVWSSAEALGEVSEEVGDEVEVYVDGGVRRGLHALAAAALGARSVFLGRPAFYALAVDGPSGVARLLRDLAGELEESLRLSGHVSLDGVGRELLRGQPWRALTKGDEAVTQGTHPRFDGA
jgi:4-hydroxymandelate oxidase